MIITYKENETFEITFSDLCIGEVFSSGNNIYMKVDVSSNSNNAWDFCLDKFTMFDTLDEVVPMDAELVVSEKKG